MVLWSRSSFLFVWGWYYREFIYSMPCPRAPPQTRWASRIPWVVLVHAHKARSIVRQDSGQRSEPFNCLLEHHHGVLRGSLGDPTRPVTHLEASSRNVIRRSPLIRELLTTYQLVCHMGLECLCSYHAHLRFCDFASDGTTSPLSFIIRYIRW